MARTWIEQQIAKDPEFARGLEEEGLIVLATEAIAEAMAEQKMTKAALARALEVSEAYVTKLMKGENLTLRTLAKVAHVLGRRVELRMVPRGTRSASAPVRAVARRHGGARRAATVKLT